MIGLVFTIGNIFLSQQNNGVDLNNMSLESITHLFLLQESLIFWSTIVFEFLEDYVSFTILNYFGKNSLILMCTQRPFIFLLQLQDGRSYQECQESWHGDIILICLGAMILVMIIEYSITFC